MAAHMKTLSQLFHSSQLFSSIKTQGVKHCSVGFLGSHNIMYKVLISQSQQTLDVQKMIFSKYRGQVVQRYLK